MNTKFRISAATLVFIFQQNISFAQVHPDKSPTLYLQVGYNQGLFYDGNIEVRESIYDGTFLRLKENLGMSSWLSPRMTLGINYSDKNIFEFTYTRHFFHGSEFIPNPTWFNGTLSAPSSKASIDKTIYRGFELAWKARILHAAKTDIYSRLAINYERLKFYVDAPIAEQSPFRETYEAFWRQQLPLPTIGVYANHRFSDRWSMNAEAYATYLPYTKTWMKEGGTMHLQQSNLDADLHLVYNWKMISVSPGIWYKYFKIKEESKEDENEFLLSGFGYNLSLTVNY